MVLKSVGGMTAVGLLGPVGLVAAATVPAYLVYRRLFAREDASLREAVAALTAEVETRSAEGERGEEAVGEAAS